MKLPIDDSTPARTRIIDSHVHFVHPERMEDILALMDAVPCAAFNLVSLPNRDGTHQNDVALAFKERYPERVFACGALNYGAVLDDPVSAPVRLGDQVHHLRAQGFDGLKLIEGKPEVQGAPPPTRRTASTRRGGAGGSAAAGAIVHVGDPDEFWDAERCPPGRGQRAGTIRTEPTPAKEQLYNEIDPRAGPPPAPQNSLHPLLFRHAIWSERRAFSTPPRLLSTWHHIWTCIRTSARIRPPCANFFLAYQKPYPLRHRYRHACY